MQYCKVQVLYVKTVIMQYDAKLFPPERSSSVHVQQLVL